MNRYPITELIARRSGGTLTVEQLIGQIVLALHEAEQRQQALEQRQRAVEHSLAAPPENAPPTPPTAKGRRSKQG